MVGEKQKLHLISHAKNSPRTLCKRKYTVCLSIRVDGSASMQVTVYYILTNIWHCVVHGAVHCNSLR